MQLYLRSVLAHLPAPVMLLDQYGDKQTLARQYPQMVKWMKHMTKYIDDDLMPKDKYGDWCVPPEDLKLVHSKDPARQTAGPILGTTYYYYCLELMTRCARLLEHPVEREIERLEKQLTTYAALGAPVMVYAETTGTVQNKQKIPVSQRPRKSGICIASK